MRVTLRDRREAQGLSQSALAERAQISRQALIAIEAGRQVPSTAIALRLAATLRCRVEDLFSLDRPDRLRVRSTATVGDRALLARVGDVWVAHAAATPGQAADAVLDTPDSAEPLFELDDLERNVFVAGCAPVIAVIAERLGTNRDVRLRWVPAGSTKALDLLASRTVNVAGCHFTNNEAAVRKRFDEPMLVVNLVRWRQGLLVSPGNPMGLSHPSDLVGRDLRVAWRERGSGAYKLLLKSTGANKSALPDGPRAAGHTDVARAVSFGAADAGVAIESEALAFGLPFVPLAEERFDLVVPASASSDPRVVRLLDALDQPRLRRDLAAIGGYDASVTGHVTTVEPR